MNSSSLLELEDEGISQLLFIRDMIADMMHNQEQGELSPEGGTNVIVSDGNVLPPLPSTVAHINTHTTGTHPEATTTDVVSRASSPESQQNVLISSHMRCQERNVSLTPHMTDTPLTDNGCNQSRSPQAMLSPCSNADQHSINTSEGMIALKDLPLLQRKEFKIHGVQIGDYSSDMLQQYQYTN